MSDKDNCIYSSDVISFAREKGYFNGVNKDFSFADAYAPLDFGALRYCEARVWSYFNMFTDRGQELLPYIEGKTKQPMLDNEDKTELIEAFYKDLEFGTGGLRGIMGVGSNRMVFSRVIRSSAVRLSNSSRSFAVCC